MGSDIERRPSRDLEITQVDSLLQKAHEAMLFTLDPAFRGTWQISTRAAATTKTDFITIDAGKVAVLTKFGEDTVFEKFTDGVTQTEDFFTVNSEVYEGRSKKDYEGTVVKSGEKCSLENINQVRVGIFRLGEIRRLVTPLVHPQDVVMPQIPRAA